MEGNAALAAAMQQLGLGQAELARRLDEEARRITGRDHQLTDRQVRRWLKGEVQWPHAVQRMALEAVLKQPAVELGFKPRSRHPAEEDPLERRTFCAAIAAIAPAHPRIGQSDVARLQAQYTEIITAGNELGGRKAIEDRAADLISRIESALSSGTASARTRSKLYHLAADVTCAAAFAAIDRRATVRARDHLGKAVTFAGLSGVSETQYRVWNQVAMLAGQRRDFAEQGAAAEAAKRQAAYRRDPLYTSLAHMRTAICQSEIGDRTAALRALSAAERSFERQQQIIRPLWISFYDAAELDGLAGLVWLRLGEPARAEAQLHRALAALRPDLVRNRAYYTAHLSLAQAQQGEVALACSTSDCATAILSGVRSARTYTTLKKVRTLINTAHSADPHIQEWAERAEAWK
ncbi:XRE family transcriptional regulator [Streptomyces sp. 796.1]|uniref:XRE family transcriptional regulator n=1 Tax=Streptomyces sp. 796.1 TaxID=3163029 RepID=UPI0039C9ECC4